MGRELERFRPIALARHHVSRHHRRCLEGGVSRLRRVHDRETTLPDRKRKDIAIQGSIRRINRHRAQEGGDEDIGNRFLEGSEQMADAGQDALDVYPLGLEALGEYTVRGLRVPFGRPGEIFDIILLSLTS